jgi:hypothetical protein
MIFLNPSMQMKEQCLDSTRTVPFQRKGLINALLGNSSLNTVQHATIEEAVFSVDPTDAPIDWLDSDHVFTVRPCPFRSYITRAVNCEFRANWN